jgi:hypothetical protein
MAGRGDLLGAVARSDRVVLADGLPGLLARPAGSLAWAAPPVA